MGPAWPSFRSPGWTDGAHVQSSTASPIATSMQVGLEAAASEAGTVTVADDPTEDVDAVDGEICSVARSLRVRLGAGVDLFVSSSSSSSTYTVTGTDGEGRPSETNL